MKKLIVTIMILLSVNVYSQSTVDKLKSSSKQLNIGLGGSDGGLPVYVGMDFFVKPEISIGPVAKVILDSSIYFGALVRGDYHFNKLLKLPSEFDLYGGLHIGLGEIKVGKASGVDISPGWGLQLGGRWFWSEIWGLNIEFGGGSGFGGTLGVTMKM